MRWERLDFHRSEPAWLAFDKCDKAKWNTRVRVRLEIVNCIAIAAATIVRGPLTLEPLGQERNQLGALRQRCDRDVRRSAQSDLTFELGRWCMKRNPVTFAVEHDSAKAVRPDLMNRLQDLTTFGGDRLDSLSEASLCVEIDERADFGRRVVGAGRVQATANVISGVRQQPEDKARASFLGYRTSEDGGIESDCALEVQDRDIDPDDAVAHTLAPFEGM